MNEVLNHQHRRSHVEDEKLVVNYNHASNARNSKLLNDNHENDDDEYSISF